MLIRAVVLVAPLLALTQVSVAGSRYTVTEVPGFSIWGSGLADLNLYGAAVAGSGQPNGIGTVGFTWSCGQSRPLPVPAGYRYCHGRAINAAGQVGGDASLTTDDHHPFRWSQEEVLFLGLIGTGRVAISTGINAAGHVVGISETDDSLFPLTRAFLYDGVLHDLGTLTNTGEEASSAADINDTGVIVGASNRIEGSLRSVRAVRWVNGEIEDLGFLAGDTGASARAINNAGQIAGFTARSRFPEAYDRVAVLWDGDTIIQIGPLVPDDPQTHYRFASEATDVNIWGQVVGGGATGYQSGTSFIWENGVLEDLQTLIPADSGW